MSLHGKVEYVVHLEHQKDWHWDKLVDYQYGVAIRSMGEPLIFVDLWDSLFVGDVDELETRITRLDKCTVQASKVLWPSTSVDDRIKRMQANVKSPWKYVNGSFVAGMGFQIAKALEYGMKHYPIKPRDLAYHPHDYEHNDNNGRMWSEVFADGMCDIDSECHISQQLNRIEPGQLSFSAGTGRINNTITGGKPHFLHASNDTWGFIPEFLIKKVTGRA
jgi:hypothetical protein